MSKTNSTKIQKILHNGNHSKAVLAKYKNTLCVIKKYYNRNTKEFEREKHILKQISHENIISPVFIGRSRTIVTDSVGMTLRNHMTDKKIDDDTILRFSRQIVQALSYLHSHKIVHFDLKPENIVICGDSVKLIDFGSAKFEDERIDFIDTTVSYTSLEYLVGLKIAYSFKDIWSFGCILYEMIKGETILKTTNTFSIIAEILDIFGSPNKESFSLLDIKHADFINIYERKETKFNLMFNQFNLHLISLFRKIFMMEPFERISADKLSQELETVPLVSKDAISK